MTYNSISYKHFHSIGDMLIGSIKTIASILPEKLFVCTKERKIILTYLNFISINTKKPLSTPALTILTNKIT